jgi:hypothetical protein
MDYVPKYLGCTIQNFMAHIESQFKDNMDWTNHGEWHIDHVIPLTYKENPEDVLTEDITIERLHYTNTQPLWAADNIAKGNRFIG